MWRNKKKETSKNILLAVRKHARAHVTQMSGDEAELDAVVDSILLGGARPSASSSSSPASALDPASAFPSTEKLISAHPTASTAARNKTAKTEYIPVDTNIWCAAPPTSAAPHHGDVPLHSGRQEIAGAQDSADANDEEDLNALVERILAGPAPAAKDSRTSQPFHFDVSGAVPAVSSGSPSSLSSHALSSHYSPHRHPRGGPPSPAIPSSSISPASSSPRYQLPLSFAQHRSHDSQPGTQQQQQQRRASISGGSSGATSRRTGGATRADTSLSRVSASGGLLNAPSTAAASGMASSPMDAVVRRLTLWQERREAKRVQAVYEALEKEHEECTFEPSINRLDSVEGNRSAITSARRCRSMEEAVEEEGDEEVADAEGCEEDRSWLASRNTYGDTSRRNRSGTSADPSYSSSTSYMGEVGIVPSLLPPQQPIYGVDAFVNRLRRAQGERDALKAAEEAKRLRYYDTSTFSRDLTMPAPFEFGDTRQRRLVSSTVPVPGVRSPLARLRATSLYADSRNGQTLTCLPSRGSLANSSAAIGAIGNNTLTNRSPYSHTLRPGCLPEDEVGNDDDDENGFATGVYGEIVGEEEARMTAENTFLSLAPQIREYLLFDLRMEQQLHRATESIRRGIA